MEHRYSKRINANIQTMIYKYGLPVAIGRVRDTSRQGIFIDCEPDTAVLNQPLEIELFLHGRRMEKFGRFKCFVVRKEIQGVGLCLFDDCQSSYVQCTEYILAKQKASTAISGAHSPQRNAFLALRRMYN